MAPRCPAALSAAGGPSIALAWPEVLLYLLGTFSSVDEVAAAFTPQARRSGTCHLHCMGHTQPAGGAADVLSKGM